MFCSCSLVVKAQAPAVLRMQAQHGVACWYSHVHNYSSSYSSCTCGLTFRVLLCLKQVN